MPGKRAKILSAADVGDLLVFASCTRHPLRNTVMVLLSAKAGLRAGEIANLTWDMVVDANGQINGVIELTDTAAKKRSGRTIPVHPELVAALAAWREQHRCCVRLANGRSELSRCRIAAWTLSALRSARMSSIHVADPARPQRHGSAEQRGRLLQLIACQSRGDFFGWFDDAE
jgi:integrase